MPFKVKWEDETETEQEETVDPRPTAIDYPVKRDFQRQVTKDGVTVLQRPIRDSRPRRWIWTGYPKDHPEFEPLWELLESLEVKARLDAELPPLVGVFEDVTGTGGFDRTEGGIPVFTKVRIIQVTRHPIGRSKIMYDAHIEFVIEDEEWDYF